MTAIEYELFPDQGIVTVSPSGEVRTAIALRVE